MTELAIPQSIFRNFDARIDDVDRTARTIKSIISTEDIDRLNTVFSARGCSLENYRLNPVVLHEHGNDPRRGKDPVGTNQWIVPDPPNRPTRIIGQTQFLNDDFSQQRYEWYRDGVLSGISIGARPKWEACGPADQDEIRANPKLAEGFFIENGGGRGVYMYRDWELVEYSTTSQPANPKALTYERALQLVDLNRDCGLWLPDDVLTICRTMTSQTGAIAIEPQQEESKDEGGDISKRYIKQDGDKFYVMSESDKVLGGPYGSRKKAEKRLQQIEYFKHKDSDRSVPSKPRGPYIDTDGTNWWIDQSGSRVGSFSDAADAEGLLQIMVNGSRFDAELELARSVGEIRQAKTELLQDVKDLIALYRYGRV